MRPLIITLVLTILIVSTQTAYLQGKRTGRQSACVDIYTDLITKAYNQKPDSEIVGEFCKQRME